MYVYFIINFFNKKKKEMVSNADDEKEMRKSSTMGSMYIRSTISKPNIESIINAVATILHSQMLEVCALNYLYKKLIKDSYKLTRQII